MGKRHQSRHSFRSQQPRIVAAESTLVLGKAETEKVVGVEVGSDRTASGKGEIVVLFLAAHIARNADALPNQESPYCRDFRGEERLSPPRQIAAVPCHPVREEE